MNIIKKLLLISVISVLFALPAYGAVTEDVEKGRITYEDNFNDKSPTVHKNGNLYDGTADPGRYGSDTVYKASSNNEKGGVVASINAPVGTAVQSGDVIITLN